MHNLLYIAQSLLPLLVAFFLAKVLINQKAFGFITSRKERLGCIDGLRGYLALFVLITHAQLTWNYHITGEWTGNSLMLSDFGLIGVSLFFMITGFLFTSKIIKEEGKTNWLKMLKSRVFRIYPLYLFVLLCVSIIVFTSSRFAVNNGMISLSYDYFKWIVFYGGDINSYTGTPLIVAGVVWTLKYEWFFYLSLPFTSFLLYKFRALGAGCIIILAIIGYIYPITIIPAISSKYFVLFVIGGSISYLNKKGVFKKINFNTGLFSTVIVLSFILSLFLTKSHPNITIILISFIFLSVCNGATIFGFLSNSASVLLGEISYSIYLIHGVILYLIFTFFDLYDLSKYSFIEFNFIFLPAITFPVVLLSTLTFLYIEKPGILLGHKALLFKFSIKERKTSYSEEGNN